MSLPLCIHDTISPLKISDQPPLQKKLIPTCTAATLVSLQLATITFQCQKSVSHDDYTSSR